MDKVIEAAANEIYRVYHSTIPAEGVEIVAEAAIKAADAARAEDVKAALDAYDEANSEHERAADEGYGYTASRERIEATWDAVQARRRDLLALIGITEPSGE